MVTLGSRLKALRVSSALNLDELADLFNKNYGTDANKSTVSRWENDKQVPHIEHVRNYCEHFGVSLDYLLGYSDSKSSVNSHDIFSVASNLYSLWADDPVFKEIYNCYSQLDDRRKEFLRSYAAYLITEGESDG